MSTPDWLSRALRDNPAPPASPDRTEDPCDLYAGDLWLLEHDSADGVRTKRIVLVLNTGSARIHGALASNETEWASPQDIILRREETNAPFDLMIETPLHARFWWRDVVRRIGTISNERLDQVLDFIWGERPAALEALRGTPLRPSLEREEFEAAELADLHRLAETSDERFGTVSTLPKAVDVGSALDISQTSRADACEMLDALLAPGLLLCAGLVNAGRADVPAGVEGIAASAISAATGRLFSGDPVVATFSTFGGEHTVVCSSPLATNALAVRLVGATAVGGPLGFLGHTPVIAARDEDT